LGYVGKAADGGYEPFYFNRQLGAADVEITDEMYIITRETAEAYEKKVAEGQDGTGPEPEFLTPDKPGIATTGGTPEKPAGLEPIPAKITQLTWAGDIPPQKWSNYYTKVLSKFATNNELVLSLQVAIRNSAGISEHQVEEMKAALRELGLEERVSAR